MLKGLIAKHIAIIRVVLARELGHCLQSGVKADINAGLAFHTTLGGNQDNAVSTLHTVNGCGRGVFQHGDGSH